LSKDRADAPRRGLASSHEARGEDPTCRRWTTKRRLWLVLLLAGAAAIAEAFEIGPWIAVPIGVLALRLGIPLDSRSWIRPTLTALVVALVILAGMRVLMGMPYVAISVPSPDGRVVAELVETYSFIDRRFEIRLTTRWLGVIPRRRTLFQSPDEGGRGERLLWSRDGRYVLLVGPKLFAVAEACLASGDKLYLLADASTGSVRVNATQTRHARFSVEDLAGMDFTVPLAPGVLKGPRWAQRCAPPS
jgi:hypothetical protein